MKIREYKVVVRKDIEVRVRAKTIEGAYSQAKKWSLTDGCVPKELETEPMVSTIRLVKDELMCDVCKQVIENKKDGIRGGSGKAYHKGCL